MAVIRKIEPSKHVSGRYLVWLEEREPLRVTAEEVLAFGLRAGQTLSAEEEAQLRRAGAASGVRETAARIVGAKPLSRGELLERLRRKGASEQDALDAADWLEELGVLNDAAYAALVVRHYSARGYGEKKLRQELWKRRIPQPLWEEALLQAENAEESLPRLIERRLAGKTPDRQELGRLQNYLLRRGYRWDEVRDALEQYGAEDMN